MRKFLIAVVLLLMLAAGVGLFAWFRYTEFLQPFPLDQPSKTVEVSVSQGSTAQEILDQLQREGVIADATLAKYYLVYVLGDPALQAGDYSFDLPATPSQVLAKIVDGDVLLDTVTVIEGLTLTETAASLANQGFGDQAVLEQEMSRVSLIDDLDASATSLEGYLFPDTYSFRRNVTERQIVERMVANFRNQASQLLEGKSAKEVVTLASIVEKEATIDEERPLIAGVYAHRLRKGIGLYADPTLIYGKKLEGDWDGNLRKKDLQEDGPYNTYTRGGLPPTPICSPGRASLEAAANPPDVPYLYFVSRNDGSHVFAETLAEHNRNVERWQRQYWREKRREERSNDTNE